MNEKTSVLRLRKRAHDALATLSPMVEEVVGAMAILEDPENHTKEKLEEAERGVEKLEALINSGKILKAQEVLRATEQALAEGYEALAKGYKELAKEYEALLDTCEAPVEIREIPEMTPVIDRGLHDS